MVTLVDVGKACRKIRQSKHMSQKQVAKATGYNDRTISQFERGYSNNALILIWYITNGLELGGLNYGKVTDSIGAIHK
jgi:transcriptional regulator with XRE-family HTH domain